VSYVGEKKIYKNIILRFVIMPRFLSSLNPLGQGKTTPS
jgi:hypothetical protein